MRYTQLGESDLRISQITVGCWQFSHQWTDNLDIENVVRIADYAVDHGINFFDTAHAYGKGQSERVVAKILKRHKGRIHVATKAKQGVRYTLPDLRNTLESSLTNLETECIDLFQIHWPRRPFEREDAEIIIDAFETFRNEGKIRAGGISNFKGEQISFMAGRPDLIVSNQMPYSLFWRYIEDDDARLSHENGMGVITYSSLAQGFLAGKYLVGSTPGKHVPAKLCFSQDEHFTFMTERAQRIHDVAEEMGVSMASLAVAWNLKNEYVTSAICGMSKERHIDDIIAALDITLDASVMAHLDEITRPVYERFQKTGTLWGWLGPEKKPEEIHAGR